MDINKFKESLPLLSMEHVRNKTKELKYRLREIKKVIEYPKSKVGEAIESIINETEFKTVMPHRSPSKQIANLNSIPMTIKDQDL